MAIYISTLLKILFAHLQKSSENQSFRNILFIREAILMIHCYNFGEYKTVGVNTK